MSYDDGYAGSRETVVTPAAPELPEALRAAVRGAVLEQFSSSPRTLFDRTLEALTAAWPAVEHELRREAQQQVGAQIEGLQAEVARLSAGPDHAAELAWWKRAAAQDVAVVAEVEGVLLVVGARQLTVARAEGGGAPEPPPVVGLVGDILDQIDNLLAAAHLPVNPAIHVEGLVGGLKEIRQKLAAALGMEDK